MKLIDKIMNEIFAREYYSTVEEARTVLHKLKEDININGYATVNDYYKYSGNNKTSPPEYKWRDLSSCAIFLDGNRCYIGGLEEALEYVPDLPIISENDPVNHPSHYTAGGIECIDAIGAALTSQSDPMSAWLTGQCLKYLWRWPLKNGVEDLKKTRFYLDRLIEHEEKKQ